MSRNFTVSIIAIGSEITSGKIQDSHGKYLSSHLESMGFSVRSIFLIPDNSDIKFYIDIEKNRSDVLIITGGLGPTSDDITRDVVASAAGVDLVFNKSVMEKLDEKYPSVNNGSRAKQAYIPEGFTILENYCGTAPGFYGSVGSSTVFSLPGPPSEMRDMFNRSVRNILLSLFRLPVREVLTLSCFLMCESGLEDACLKYGSDDVSWGTMVQPYKISLYLNGGSEDTRNQFFLYLQSVFGKNLVVSGNVSAEEILSRSLKSCRKTLCTAESMTGGLVSKLITDLPGSSEIFWGAFVTYSNNAKESILNIDNQILDQSGAVSKEVVLKMAAQSRHKSGADIAISISGYADSSELGKEFIGTVWIGISTAEGVERGRMFKFRGSRDLVRRKSAVAAMILAETALTTPERLDSCCQWQYS